MVRAEFRGTRCYVELRCTQERLCFAYPLGMTVPNVRWQAADWGTVCEGRAHDEFIDCVNQCVQTRAAGLSSGCTSCYGDLAWCVGTACNTWCANPASRSRLPHRQAPDELLLALADGERSGYS